MSETIQTANAAASKLPKGKIVTRLVAIAIVAAGSAALFAFAGGWLTPHVLTPARFVNTFEHLNGVHPGFRRNHAKGVCVSGHFDSNGQGVELCKASVFQSGRVPLIGRFSLSGGDPHAADAATTVRGFGLQFQLAESEEWRIAVVNLPVFPENTPQAFHDLLLATAPNPATGKPDMDKIQAFVKGHPEFVMYGPLFGGHVLVHRDEFAGAPLAQAHQTLVYRDPDQPCVELRVPLKLVELLVCLEKRVLHDVFGVFAVLRDVLRDPEDLPLVLADQGVVGSDIAAANSCDQRHVGMLLVWCRNWLDG